MKIIFIIFLLFPVFSYGGFTTTFWKHKKSQTIARVQYKHSYVSNSAVFDSSHQNTAGNFLVVFISGAASANGAS
jgi:hypothetical protein